MIESKVAMAATVAFCVGYRRKDLPSEETVIIQSGRGEIDFRGAVGAKSRKRESEKTKTRIDLRWN